ncbi:hypothetical protein FHL15_000716 [Xylaria flabelliformis]|uniref:Uncharacterized protein n=1 Tax=Xylaria flabelliformis TaxID=2512241 RepID=A0A553IEK0_9PEZI|nr:hypothetical protein FHL15_000716 [Xylaria flabelliformis]
MLPSSTSSLTLFPNSTITGVSVTGSMSTGSGSSSSLSTSPGSQSNGSGSGTWTWTRSRSSSSSNSNNGGDTSSTPTSSVSSLSQSASSSLTDMETMPSISPPPPTPTFPSTSTSLSESGTFTSSSTSNTISAPSTSGTCDPTPADTGILDNGDFETGLSPWSLDLVDLFSTDYSLSSLLSSPSLPQFLNLGGANGSCTSFSVTMASNPQTQNLRENLRLRSDLVFSRPGAALRITFFVRFAAQNAARLVLSANGQLLRTISAVDFGPGGDAEGGGGGGNVTGAAVKAKKRQEEEPIGAWTPVFVDYITRDRLLQLTFSYGLESAPGNTVWLDQVAIFPGVVNPPTLPPPPLSPTTTTFATTVRSVA